jgi:uncharacterized membrane protein YqhA
MFAHILKLRYVTVVISIIAGLDALSFLIMGAKAAFKGYVHMIASGDAFEMSRPGLELLHSLDFLLVSLVLMILAFGVAKLFLLDPKTALTLELPSWLRIESISELKVLLWETILTTLLVVSLSGLSDGLFRKLDWTVLLTPIAILLLTLSLYFMRRGLTRS